MPDDLVSRMRAQAATMTHRPRWADTEFVLRQGATQIEWLYEQAAAEYARGVNDALAVVEAYAEACRSGGQYLRTLSLGAAACADRIRALLDQKGESDARPGNPLAGAGRRERREHVHGPTAPGGDG